LMTALRMSRSTPIWSWTMWPCRCCSISPPSAMKSWKTRWIRWPLNRRRSAWSARRS